MQRFEVAHITFEVDEKEKTFALIAGKAMQAKDRKPLFSGCLLYTSPSPRDAHESRMPSSA